MDKSTRHQCSESHFNEYGGSPHTKKQLPDTHRIREINSILTLCTNRQIAQAKGLVLLEGSLTSLPLDTGPKPRLRFLPLQFQPHPRMPVTSQVPTTPPWIWLICRSSSWNSGKPFTRHITILLQKDGTQEEQMGETRRRRHGERTQSFQVLSRWATRPASHPEALRPSPWGLPWWLHYTGEIN